MDLEQHLGSSKGVLVDALLDAPEVAHRYRILRIRLWVSVSQTGARLTNYGRFVPGCWGTERCDQSVIPRFSRENDGSGV
jgi:hypothetical protein